MCVIIVKNTPKYSGKDNSSGMANKLAYDTILIENRLIRQPKKVSSNKKL